MGIKFHCPNGHKLNVKAFLAGKKGVCPKCGTKVRIPTASEPGLVDSDLEETGAGQSSLAKSNGSGVVNATIATAPALAAPAVSVTPAGLQQAQAAGAAAEDDPIAEAPAAIWYVRPPTGGQYGPARGEVMRKWISEGRVSSDSLVWREGWTDWQNAGKLFPTLENAGGAPAPVPAPVVSTTVPLSPRSSTRTAARYEAKKQNTSSLAIAILVGLGILCLILAAVLVYAVIRLK
jgi:GYF domain 2